MQANRLLCSIYDGLDFKHTGAACVLHNLTQSKIESFFSQHIIKMRQMNICVDLRTQSVFSADGNQISCRKIRANDCEALPLTVTEWPAAVLTPRRWTNWFVPSGVHLERGHRYGMHTSPGGYWCHCGTCLLHSLAVSTAQIYLHSQFSLFQIWNQQKIGSWDLEFCQLMAFMNVFIL